jgi:hypothetical protein
VLCTEALVVLWRNGIKLEFSRICSSSSLVPKDPPLPQSCFCRSLRLTTCKHSSTRKRSHNSEPACSSYVLQLPRPPLAFPSVTNLKCFFFLPGRTCQAHMPDTNGRQYPTTIGFPWLSLIKSLTMSVTLIVSLIDAAESHWPCLCQSLQRT